VRLRLESNDLILEAVVTRHAVEELRLEAGASVVGQVKATALHVFPV
jgi:molybdopterin-binding protein